LPDVFESSKSGVYDLNEAVGVDDQGLFILFDDLVPRQKTIPKGASEWVAGLAHLKADPASGIEIWRSGEFHTHLQKPFEGEQGFIPSLNQVNSAIFALFIGKC
jgi:hypothetical protein